jgi:hypothetical protein
MPTQKEIDTATTMNANFKANLAQVRILTSLDEFPDYEEDFRALGYNLGWYDPMDHPNNDWNVRKLTAPANENAVETIWRKAAYTVLRATIKENYEHLTDGLRIGDVDTLYGTLQEHFQPRTNGGFMQANNALQQSSMQKDHINICDFGQLVSKRARNLDGYAQSGPNPTSEMLKIAIVSAGLVPEFKYIKDILDNEIITNKISFRDYMKRLIEYAQSNGLTDIIQGGKPGSAIRVFETEIKTAPAHSRDSREPSICFNFRDTGRCKYEDKCLYSHVKSNTNRRDRPSPPKSYCEYCSKQGHSAEKCFKKTADEREKVLGEKLKTSEAYNLELKERLATRDPYENFAITSEAQFDVFVTSINHEKSSNENDGRDLWICDNGSNRHVTNDIRDYVEGTIRPISAEVKTGMGAGKVTKEGNVMMFAKDTGTRFMLKNVIYLPLSDRKVISELRLLRNKCRVVDDGTTGKLRRSIIKQDGNLLTVAKQGVGGSEMFIFNDIKVITATTSSDGNGKTRVASNTDGTPQLKTSDGCYGMEMKDDSSTEASLILEYHRKLGHLHFRAVRKSLGLKASTDDPPRVRNAQLSNQNRTEWTRCLAGQKRVVYYNA